MSFTIYYHIKRQDPTISAASEAVAIAVRTTGGKK
jgi:hypothetical protein